MTKRKARNIAKMSVQEVWDEYDDNGVFDLTFDDGVAKKMTGRTIIFSHYIWEFHRRYPKTPLLKRHQLSEQLIGTGTHLDLLSVVLQDTWEIYRKEGVDIEDLWKLAYDVTNHIYNDMTYRLEAYVTSISALDFLDVCDHPEVAAANEEYEKGEDGGPSVEDTYAKIKHVLLNAPELSENGVAKAARSGLVSMGQILQCVGPRGFPTDIDSRIFPKPIRRGFFQGLNLLEDAMKESRSAAKALFFTKDPMQKSEYFNRNIQLSAATLSNLHHGDCGSTDLIPFTVSPGDLSPGLDGIYYQNEKTKKLERITRGHKHLIGKTIHIRSVFGCKHPDPYGICSTCFGELALSVPRNTNIGHVSSTVMQSDIGQRLLSTKHEDQSSSVETQPLDNYTARFIRTFDDPNHLGLKDNLKADKILMYIPEESAKNLYDVSYVDDVSNLVITRITSVSEIQLIITRGKREEIHVVNVANGPREASFSHAALNHIKKKGWSMSKDGEYVIDMTDWPRDKVLFELPLKHHSMVEYMKLIEKVIKGTGDSSTKTLMDFDDPAAALAEFYDLVSSKMSISLSHLQVVLLSTMARNAEQDDYRLPKPGNTGKFVSYRENMSMRSLSPMMAFQRQAPTLESLKSYITKVRPIHPLDPLLMPADSE